MSAKLRRLPVILGDWRWWPFYLQRRVRGPAARRRVAATIARLRPSAPATDPAVETQAVTLARDGIVLLGSMLDDAKCTAIVDHFRRLPVIDDYRPAAPAFLPLASGRHPDSHVAYHVAIDVVRAPHLLALANHPDLLALAGRFLGCRPTISYLAAWWSYPTGLGPQQAENFHRDVDDWQFLKLFVYLTDVDREGGPHVYVRRSADAPHLAAIRRYDDAEVAAAFPADDILTLIAKAGEGFIENTAGLHRGTPVRRGTRLMFQAVYGLTPLPYAPKRPVLRRAEVPDGERLDAYVNRLYLAA